MSARTCLIALSAAAVLGGPALAEDVTQVMNLWGVTLSFPPPSWVETVTDAANPAKTSVSRQENENTFLFEMVQKAEGFEQWTKLYGVLARRGAEFSVASFEKDVLASYGQGCSEVKGEAIPGKRDGSFFVLYCGAFRDNPKAGQVGVFRIVQLGPLTVRTYQEWRGAAFTVGQTEGLPVPAEEIEGMVKRFETVGLILAGN